MPAPKKPVTTVMGVKSLDVSSVMMYWCEFGLAFPSWPRVVRHKKASTVERRRHHVLYVRTDTVFVHFSTYVQYLRTHADRESEQDKARRISEDDSIV